MNILNFLRKTETYFICILLVLNLYCAFALKGENIVNSTHLMMACIMLIFLNEKLIKKIESDDK